MKGKAVSSEGENFTAAKVFCLQKNEALLIVDAFFPNPIFEVWDSSRQALHDSQFKETEQ